MTKQETFDIVARHLLTQGEQARDVNGCKYRAPDGKKCAVGCLIPDERYSSDMEDTSVTWGPVCKLMIELEHDIDLLEAMRDIHDDGYNWPVELRQVAFAYGLSDAVVTELRGPA